MSLEVAIILVGLSIIPLSVLVFAPMFFKDKLANLNKPLIFFFGLAALLFEFRNFYRASHFSMEQHQWTGAALMTGFFPFYATYIMIVACLFAAALGYLLNTKNFKSWKAILVLVISCALLLNHRASYKETEERNALIERASGPLTPELIEDIRKNDYSKDQIQVATMLANPNVPEAVMRELADTKIVAYLVAIVKNPKIPDDLLQSLSQSDEEMVRYYSTFHSKMTNERLKEMAEKDPSKDVRQQAHTSLKYRTEAASQNTTQ